MSTGKEAEWTIHTSRRSKRPATPEALKPTPEPAASSKPKPTPEPTPEPAKTVWTIHASRRSRRPATATVTPQAHKPEPSQLTPEQTQKPEPSKPTSEPATGPSHTEPTGTNDDETASIASAGSDDSMTEDDRHTKRVKDFVPPSKLVPITNQVTSNDVSTFQQVIADSLARMLSRYTDKVALTGRRVCIPCGKGNKLQDPAQRPNRDTP